MGEEDLEDGSQSGGEDGRGGETVPRWGRPAGCRGPDYDVTAFLPS
jgi:hypothetical protein